MWIEIILIIVLFVLLFHFYFQRDPRITLNPNLPNHEIISPTYGRIYGIYEEDNHIHIITILNLMDVHMQYYPMNGRVVNQVHDRTGKYALVYDLFKSKENEKMITTIETPYGNVIVQQIAGMFVRRIFTTLKSIPEEVRGGEKLGNILFGSRVDLILPKKNLELFVSEGQKIYGGQTKIGQYK